MKRICISIILLLCVLTISSKSYSQDDFPVLEDRYFGQKPPGLTAEIFAPGIIATEDNFESDVKFSPDMKELYFVKKGGKYEKRTPLVIRYENHGWGNESVTDIRHPVFNNDDGNIMYHGNKYRERTDTGWSEKKVLEHLSKTSTLWVFRFHPKEPIILILWKGKAMAISVIHAS